MRTMIPGDVKRAAYFERRREELGAERFLARLRSAPLISPLKIEARSRREGGWTVAKVFDASEKAPN